MKKSFLIVFTLFMITACGDADDKGKSTTSTSISNGGTSFGGGNAGEGSGDSQMEPSTDVSCSDACANATEWCGTQLGTYDDCVSVCPEMGQSILNCIGTANSCQEVTSCAEGSQGGTNAGTGNNGGTNGAVGTQCIGNPECQSGYCRKQPGASLGVCEVNDFGEVCQTDTDCNGNCAYRDGTADVSGICTYTCDTDFDCPFGWDCVQYANGAASVCWES